MGLGSATRRWPRRAARSLASHLDRVPYNPNYLPYVEDAKCNHLPSFSLLPYCHAERGRIPLLVCRSLIYFRYARRYRYGKVQAGRVDKVPAGSFAGSPARMAQHSRDVIGRKQSSRHAIARGLGQNQMSLPDRDETTAERAVSCRSRLVHRSSDCGRSQRHVALNLRAARVLRLG